MYWTIQSKDVLRTIQEQGRYYPDFRKSDYLKQIPANGPLYLQLLKAMNDVNAISANDRQGNGLVFCFYGYDPENNAPLDNINDFLNFIDHHQPAIASLWQHLTADPNNVMLQVNFDAPFFNPLLIDINDFQFLMPPVSVGTPFSFKDINAILDSVASGRLHKSAMPGNVLQAHLPFIDQSNLVNAYALN